jgi:hypothetical protein
LVVWLQERSRDGSSFAADDWDDRPRTIEEIQAMLQTRKDAALKRERALSYAFSHQVRLFFFCCKTRFLSFSGVLWLIA